MTFLDKVQINEYTIKFYSGFSLQKVLNHPKSGTSGFMVLLIDSIQEERLKYSRELKINNIIHNAEYSSFDDVLQNLGNNFIMIYQSNGENVKLIEILKDKFRREFFKCWEVL